MISLFPKNKELRLRQDILRGVYEDNLRIIGKKRDAGLAKHRPFFLRKPFLIVFITLAAILVHGKYVTPPFSHEAQSTASPIGKMSLPQTATISMDGANPSDYKALMANSKMPLSRVFGLGIKTIIIDAGHGGADAGTTGRSGTKEKDITLDIAKRLKARLEKTGRYNVLMTRDQDITVPLNRRVEMAVESKADLFISIHLNYLPSKPINIIETYYFGPSSDAKVLKLAEQENAGSPYGLSDFREIIGKIGETMKLQESRQLATLIQKNLFSNIKRENGIAYDFGVKRAPFVVLLGVDVPAVLAEVSCLSNSDEEIRMNTESHRENIAHYLEAGILDYSNKGEKTYESKNRAER
jgi:N-acetylmuramoyl-L-alanine amidase